MARLAPILLIVALAIVPSAASANTQTQKSLERADLPAAADIRLARVSHAGKDLVHEIQTYGSWKPRDLTTTYSSSQDGIAFFTHLATKEPMMYVIGGGRYQLQATWAGGSRVRGTLYDAVTGKSRTVTASHPDARTNRRQPRERLRHLAASRHPELRLHSLGYITTIIERRTVVRRLGAASGPRRRHGRARRVASCAASLRRP